MSEFIVGQRWMSGPESELGLGLVSDVSTKRVTVLFLACDERRVYAQDNAPLTRVRFLRGDTLETESGMKATVTGVLEQQGVVRYQVINGAGETVFIDEMELSHHLQFNKPQDKLFTGQAEAGRWFALRYETWRHLQRLQQSHVKGLLGARTSLIPHQLYIAYEAAKRDCVRIMLADEVGLGKTIEAGLVLHHRLQMGLAARVMILVPESLLHQWLVEMLRRFNLAFSIFDEQRCQATEEENPFLSEQLILCSLSFFEENPHRQEQAIRAGWDVVVVDEAHHLQWNERAPSEAYVFVDKLAQVSDGLVLLTATPEQQGKQTHFAQLRLLDADRFHSFALFLAEERAFEPVAHLAGKVMHDALLGEADRCLLKTLVDAGLCAEFLQGSGGGERKQEILNQLVDRHGTGRILFRNSRQVVQGFPEREFYAYPLQSDMKGVDQVYLDWLVDKIKCLGDDRALLICKHAQTVLRLQKSLRERFAINAATFHEGMSIIERDRAAAYFADNEAQVRILLCSEIGSEGRNFQFVHHLILLDLPENPDLLQQRIGRLDRIGQRHVIQIHVPYIVGSKQHSLCRWYDKGLQLFQVNNNAASEVYRIQGQALEQVCGSTDQTGLDELVSEGRVLIKKIETEMHQSRDLLLELNSCRKEIATQLVDNVSQALQPQALWQYMEEVFECFGVDSEFHSKDCVILQPGQLQRVTQFPYVPEDGVTVTVSREVALAREDMQYLSWEHPMVVSAMDLVLSDNVGSAALSVVNHSELAEGQYLLECLFLIECSAPAYLQLSRFLPAIPLRILIDQELEDLTEQIFHSDLLEVVHKIEIEQITAFIGSQNDNINDMIALAEQKAGLIMRENIQQASAQMLAVSAQEIKRLEALAQVNPGIKDAEIESLKDKAIASHQYIQGAKLRLDAVRFIITS